MNSAIVGHAHHFRQKVSSGDVNGNVSAQLSQTTTLFFVAGRGDDFRAEMFGDLDRRVADAATAALNQQPFTGFQSPVGQQAEPRGKEYRGSCRCLGESNPFRDGTNFGSLGDGIFGVSAETRIGNDTLPGSVFVDAGTKFFNCASEFTTRNERECIG